MTDLVYLNGLWLHGNQLTGCIPPTLWDVRNNDLSALDLTNCGASASPPPTCGGGAVGPNIESTPSLARDCAILIAVRDALAGDGALNWDLAIPIAQWAGVTVYGTPPRVRRLSLAGYYLTGHIPPQLGGLTALRALYLDYKDLTGPIPPELGNLSDLIHLYLGDNQLTGPIPAALGELRNLRFLWLSGNQLSGVIPAELGALHDLRLLALDRNQLTGPIPATLTDLRNLRLLWLRDNPGLSGCIPRGLRDVRSNYLGQLGLPDCPP